MAKCDYCGSTILFGGARVGERRYCNQKCLDGGSLVEVSRSISEDLVQRQVTQLHQGLCPKCQGPGPVDVHRSYKVWSALVMTSWSSDAQISCAGCGRKGQITAALTSLLVGWWGFPWGLVMTPVQIGRNLFAMTRSGDPYRPSPHLEQAVRVNLAAQAAQSARPGG